MFESKKLTGSRLNPSFIVDGSKVKDITCHTFSSSSIILSAFQIWCRKGTEKYQEE